MFYSHWEDFAGLLSHKNSYHRDIGLTLLANLTPADTSGKMKELLDRYLSLLHDEKYMTGCCCAANLKKIVSADITLLPKILEELLAHASKSQYKEKQEALFACEILDFIDTFYDDCSQMPGVRDFILSAVDSVSPKTKKRAKELVKSYQLK